MVRQGVCRPYRARSEFRAVDPGRRPGGLALGWYVVPLRGGERLGAGPELPPYAGVGPRVYYDGDSDRLYAGLGKSVLGYSDGKIGDSHLQVTDAEYIGDDSRA